MEQAYEKRNLKLADELLQKIDAMEKNLGPEYAALVDGRSSSIPKKTSSVPRLCWNSLHSACSVRGRSSIWVVKNPKAPAASRARDGTF